MDTDSALVLGLITGGFAMVSILSAFSDGRGPRASILTVLISGGLITYALRARPGGYRLDEIPDAFYRVVATFL